MLFVQGQIYTRRDLHNLYGGQQQGGISTPSKHDFIMLFTGEPGKYLCRLGFPFPEFENFVYDAQSDQIRWTDTGRIDTPRFPLEGMLTRHVSGNTGEIIGFELSTPGLRGQSGCPAFDTDGKVWGMQAQTAHLDLDFDVNQKVIRDGREKQIEDYAFLHVGRCVHVDILKSFMKDNNVNFREA